MARGDAELNVDPLAVVFAMLDARRRHDLEAVKALLDPAVTHQGVTAELRCEGRDQVLDNVAQSFASDDSGLDWIELTRAGDHVVLGLGGPRFEEAPWAQGCDRAFVVHTVLDGHVVAMHDFLDRGEALHAAASDSS